MKDFPSMFRISIFTKYAIRTECTFNSIRLQWPSFTFDWTRDGKKPAVKIYHALYPNSWGWSNIDIALIGNGIERNEKKKFAQLSPSCAPLCRSLSWLESNFLVNLPMPKKDGHSIGLSHHHRHRHHHRRHHRHEMKLFANCINILGSLESATAFGFERTMAVFD